MAEVVEGEMVESRSSNRGAMAMVLEDEPWVKRIRESLTVKDKDDDVDIHVSVFDVPKQLQVHKPEAYSPQFIGLGPYHHRHPELYGMERYKIDAARRALKRLLRAAPGPSPSVDVLDELVNQLKDRDLEVRAHYHRYLELSVEALSLMMIMDGAFLLEFLTIHHHHHAAADGEGEGDSSTWTKRMEHLVDLGGSGTGKKSAHSLILRDMLMLENQIPLFVLIMIKERWSSMSFDESSKRLTLMVTGLMNELCPFKMNGIFPETSCNVTKHAHLLELLYHLVVPAAPTPTDTTEIAHTTPPFSGHIVEIEGQEEKPSTATGSEHVNVMMQLFDFIAPKLRGGRLGKVMKPIELVVKAPWNKLAGIPGMPVESFMSADANQQEITIPSVSELVSAGVKFAATHGNLSSEKTIYFNRKTATLYLPAVTLDGNTEVVLRNLVAYESSAAKGPLVLTRYTELMNGIIDTDEDVALLRKRGVVLNHMKMKKRDGEAAKLWNGMSRSVQHSRVPTLDKVIEEVNRYYDGRWRVKTKRFMRKYVLSSWKMLTFLATISMLLLTTVQAFCSVYTCSRWWFGDLVAVVPSESE